MYDIKTKEAVKDFATVVKLNNKTNNVKVTFEIIKCKEELTKEESDYLGIIRSDIYYLAHELFDKVIIVTDWSDFHIYGSYQAITEYGPDYFIERVPIFFVIGCDYPFADQHIGTLCRHGFCQADHLVGLENNYVLVRTSLKDFDAMNKLHYAKVLEFESRCARDTKPVKTEPVAELKKEVRELKKEQFKHHSASKKYKAIRKAIDDKKAEIAGISDEELEEAKFSPDIEVVNLWYKRMIDEGIEPEDYIKELEGAIENEKLWIKGSRTDEEKYMHETNISTLERTIEIIRERASLKKCPVTVGMLKNILKYLSDDMPVMFSLGINENGEIGYTTTDTVNVLHNPVNDELFVALDDSIKFALINPDKTPEKIIESTKFEVITKLI